ncbi:unnamed protein product [Closterium sp. NIES-54]
MRQLEESALEIATLTAERDSARQQSTVNAPAPTHALAHSEEPIIISSGTPTQNDSVGRRSGVASEDAAQSMPGMERNRVTPRPREPREARWHVEFAATSGEYAITAPMPLKPQRPPCFDPSQRGGPTVQSWVFTMNVFFDANCVESDAAKIRYAVSLLRGPAMDWWRVIVTSPRAYEPPSQEDGPMGPAVTWMSLASGAATTPPATADSSTRSQWLTRDAAARLAIRNHLPLAECAHFGQHRTAQALYDAVVARYSSPATAALGRLLLPYLFPELSAFATVEYLVSHLCASDARYRAAVPVEFLDRNPPPMYITLYFIVTRLPDSLCSVRDHFLSLDPTSLTIDLLEQHLLAAETSAVAVGAARGTPRPPFFEGGGGGGGSGSGGGGSGGGGTGDGGTGARRVGSGGGQRQQQQRRSKTLSPQQLREWFLRGPSGGSCPAEGDCYRCVPPDLGIAAAALGASESGTLPSTAPAEALHTFTLDSSASRCFFRDSTTLTTLPAPVPVRLADPSGGLVVARSSTVLPCPAVPSGSLSGLHLPSFSTNLVSTAALQDAMVTTTIPGGQRVSICTCTRTGCHLATFTRRPMSSLYTLATEPCQVAASAQVFASGQVAASCSCRLLSHQTLLWHHRLGHPSLPRLRGMHSRLLVSGLPRSLPPLPPSPAPPCLPCVEGRQRAAPHSSSFPPTTSPLQTLHMDVWGPARISGQSRERYFLLVVDNYTRYTMVFPLHSKGQVVNVLIPWIRTVRLPLRERFGQDLPVMRMHSDRGGEFSSNLLREFCRGEGILQSFTPPDSPQQNGIAERRIGLVMEVARTSMIHAAAPHFQWPFAVQYAAHQLNLWPNVSLPETSPTMRWTGEVGDVAVFQVWGSRAFVRDTSADKLSPCAIPCDITFDESIPFYRLFPYRSTPPPPPPLFLAPGPPPFDPLPPQGPAPSIVSQVDPLSSPAPVQVAVRSGAARGATSGGAEFGGAEPGGAGSEGAETGGAEPGGGAESGGAEPQGAASSGSSAGASPRLPPQQLREWFVRHARLRSGATGAGGDGVAARASGTRGAAATGPGGAHTLGTGAAGTGGVEGAGVVGLGAGGAGAAGARVGGTRAGGTGVVLGTPSSTGLTPPLLCPPPDQSQPPLLPASPSPAPSSYTEQSGGLTERREPASRPVSPICIARRAPWLRPPLVPGTHTMALRPSSVPLHVPLPAPPESSLPAVPDPESDRARAVSPAVSRLLATAIKDPSSKSAAASALVAELLDFAAACRLDYTNALVAESASASPPSVGGECALGTVVLEDRQEDFGCLAAAVPRFASMLLAPEGDLDAPDILTPRSYVEVITGTYVDKVPPPGANIVDGMWIFMAKRPPGSPPAFMARYVARGFSLRQGVDYFQTFSPTPKMTNLRLLLQVAAQRDYELHSLDFSTAFLQGSLHEEIWLRRPPGFIGTFPPGTQWGLHRPVYGLRQAPRECHDTLRTTLAALGFAPSTADPSLFLRTDTSLPPFYVLVYLGLQITQDRARPTMNLTQSHMVHQVLHRFGFQFSSPQPTLLSTSHSLSAPPSDESVEPSGPHPELVGCLMYLMTCTRPDLAYPLSLLARYVAPGRHRKVYLDAAKRVLRYLCSTSGMGLVLGGRGPVVLNGHADASWVDDSATQRSLQGDTFSLGSGSVSWRSTRSSSVLSSSCDAEIYAEAMAAQELHWLIYLLTDLGEQPRSPPILYVDNKAMIALCQENRLEHRTKHIALRYFLARELQRRDQLRLAYVATRANTADVFTKALPSGPTTIFFPALPEAHLAPASPALSRALPQYGPSRPCLCCPVAALPSPPVAGPSRPCRRRPSLARRRLSRPCLSRPLRPCPATALSWPCLLPPVAGPSRLVRAHRRHVPARCRTSPARRRPSLARRRSSRPCICRPDAALPCCRPSRAPDLNRQLRPCPAPAPAEPRRPAEPHCPAYTAPAATAASAATDVTAATAATVATAAVASPTVLTFDAEGRAIDFDVWVDDLQLFLQCDSRDEVSLFDHTSRISTATAATADSTVR